MVSAELQEMRINLETGSEGQEEEDEEALLGERQPSRSRGLFYRFGPALAAGLLVATMALWSGSRRPRTIATLSSLEQKSETVGLPTKCYVDGPAGNLVESSMSGVPNGVCATYTFDGKTVHVPVASSTCATMKSAPGTYGDVTCCTEDLCNDKTGKETEPIRNDKTGKETEPIRNDKTGKETEPIHSFPSLCYTDGPAGNLVEYSMSGVPNGVCARYTFAGKTVHVPVASSTCAAMKSAPGTFGDVTCCTEDLCNDKPGKGAKPIHSPPSLCYTTEVAGIALFKQPMPAVPYVRCAKYTASGTTHRMAADTTMCEMMTGAGKESFPDAMCCDTDLCNGD